MFAPTIVLTRTDDVAAFVRAFVAETGVGWARKSASRRRGCESRSADLSDIGASVGDPVLAAASGRVIYVGPLWYNTATTGRGPYAIVVQHAPQLYSTYSHNERAVRLYRKVGFVEEGRRIGAWQLDGETSDIIDMVYFTHAS